MKENAAYTVAEVAALTGFSRQTVTRMFEKEKGVIILERPEQRATTLVAAHSKT